MGITKNCAKFISYAATKGVSFRETLMLGRQRLYVTATEFEANLHHFNIPGSAADFSSGYAEPLFQSVGAVVTDSLDVSAYEGANRLHDLNTPVGVEWLGKYSVVFDGGTLEHVFNFPVAIVNCYRMLKVGGHFLSITPANNQMGHGFYQFSPELYYSLFREERGMRMVQLLLAVERPDGDRDWYEVMDPAVAGSRVTLSNDRPAYLMVIAMKTADVDNPAAGVQQSDYAKTWAAAEKSGTEIVPGWKKVYRSIVPLSLRDMIYRARTTCPDAGPDGPGLADATHFKKLKV